MTKNELKNLKYILDVVRDEDIYDVDTKDILDFIKTPDTKVKQFLRDSNACFNGSLPWFKYKTCEAALTAIYKDYGYDDLDWFLSATINVGRNRYDNDPQYVRPYDDNQEQRPLKFFMDLIPKKYRTAKKAKTTKKAAKKATRGTKKRK